jgi:UDP-3-O-[3-hydroxymyristoyl] N-acetylglucosamine deacetylase
VTLSGPTIHSGEMVTATLARTDGPISFVLDRTYIPATVANVVSTDRTTTLGAEGRTVSLVEHLLAALRMAGFYTGVTVTVSGSELPILDGSAQPWLEALTGLGDPPEPPEALRVSEVVEVRLGDSFARVEPGPALLHCSVSFPHPAIGRQEWSGGPGSYTDLAAARTFGFMAEAEVLRSRGLALGAVLEHAIVFADDGPMSPLRFADEPVRHKALDAVGDLALLGRPIAASITIERGSHRLHHALMLALTSTSPLRATFKP